MIQCKTCGTQLEDGAVFCTNCGTKIEAAPEFTYGQPNNTAGNSTPVTTVNAIPEEPKKNKKPAAFALAAVLILVIAGVVFAFTKLGSKEKDLMTSSPDVYLKDTLKSNITKSIDEFTETYDKSLSATANQGYDFEVKYELSEMLTSTLASQMGVNLSDVATNISYALKDEEMSMLMGVAANGNNLLTLDLFYDLANEVLYGRVPELSSSYLKMDMATVMEQYSGLLDSSLTAGASGILATTPTTLSDLPSSAEMKELANSVTDSLLTLFDNNVTLEQNVSITANGITGTYNKFTVPVTEGQLYTVTLDILDAVKNSATLYDLFNTALAESDMDFDSAVDELKSTLDVNSTEKALDYIVYMDNDGNITGQECTLDTSNSLGYYIAKNGTDYGITAWFTAEGEELLSVSGKYTDKNGVKNGDITLNIVSDTSFDVSCTFKDVKSAGDVTTGTFTLSSSLLPGSSLTLSLNGDADKYSLELSASYMAMDLGKLIISSISKEKASVTAMEQNAAVYDINDENGLLSYMSEIDTNAFLNDLSNKLGIDLSSLLGYYAY